MRGQNEKSVKTHEKKLSGIYNRKQLTNSIKNTYKQLD